MAKLYKMTMYVCDLEEDLSLDSIKNIIREELNDGILVNCATHFSDEKEGPNIEWNDNIDLNYIDATTEQWESYFK